jgi:bifunctional UDP-N-acetylglucosamine pyrophosphorylase/glucosamine-1-phosphate N-acetyltransferase
LFLFSDAGVFMKTNAVILAAGQGTRMHSTLPKVLHPLLGRPMLIYALQAAAQATGEQPIAIIGYQAERVRQAVGERARCVLQEPQLGTGHAVQQAEALLRGNCDQVLVTTADMALFTAESYAGLIDTQRTNPGPVTLLSAIAEPTSDFGRVLRGADGGVQAVVEVAQATPEQLAIREVNTSVYCFASEWLWEALPRIPLSPKGEYYLTDIVGLAAADGLSVQALTVEDPDEATGINNRVHMAQAESVLRQRINRDWMLAGVTLIDPATTYIEPDVRIGADTVIWPNTYLQGGTVIGADCTIGPNAILRDTKTGDRCTVLASVLEHAVLEEEVSIGPFGHLRKGAYLAKGVHMGNFGEVKDSTLGPGTKMGHFSYIGNATIGPDVNIGAGTITCNFDGVNKNPTEIGAGAFIGSDTMLVAPVKVGEGARTGAGAVVTKDVPPDTLAVGVPARAIRKLKKVG